MPKIPQFFADENITPIDRGGNAWENAARRIPGFYNAAASDERQGGEARARAFKQQLWPLDIQELYDRKAAQAAGAVADAAAAAAQARSRRGSFDLGYGGVPAARGRGGSGYAGGGTAESRANEAINGGGGYGGGAQQIARGAGALGGMLADGGYGAGRRGPTDPAGGGGYTLEGGTGNFITTSESAAAMTKYNAERDEANQRDTNAAYETDRYWERYYGGDPNLPTSSSRYTTEGQAANRLGVPPPPIPAGSSQGWGQSFMGAVDSAAIPVGNALDSAASSVVNAVSNWWSGDAAVTAPIPR